MSDHSAPVKKLTQFHPLSTGECAACDQTLHFNLDTPAQDLACPYEKRDPKVVFTP